MRIRWHARNSQRRNSSRGIVRASSTREKTFAARRNRFRSREGKINGTTTTETWQGFLVCVKQYASRKRLLVPESYYPKEKSQRGKRASEKCHVDFAITRTKLAPRAAGNVFILKSDSPRPGNGEPVVCPVRRSNFFPCN